MADSMIKRPEDFTIIGENIHATRVVLRNGKRATTLEAGTEAVTFTDEAGQTRYLHVPESVKNTQAYEQGHLKHFMIAVLKGLDEDPVQRAEGRDYIHFEIRRQCAAGAHFLDLNVDEVSYDLDIQKRAMTWLVHTVQQASPIPPSIDSSNPEIIEAGLQVYDGRSGRPMINSVALERLETLELVKSHNSHVIVTAAGREGMPEDNEERVANVKLVMEAIQSHNLPLNDVTIDCLVFPISVASSYGIHFLDAVREVRKTYGPEVHVTGGLSNVSFGLPARKLINDTFIHLSIEAGIDTGIIDPVQSKIGEILQLDTNREPARLARNMLLGKDDFCMNYIQAWRDGKLT